MSNPYPRHPSCFVKDASGNATDLMLAAWKLQDMPAEALVLSAQEVKLLREIAENAAVSAKWLLRAADRAEQQAPARVEEAA